MESENEDANIIIRSSHW